MLIVKFYSLLRLFSKPWMVTNRSGGIIEENPSLEVITDFLLLFLFCFMDRDSHQYISKHLLDTRKTGIQSVNITPIIDF